MDPISESNGDEIVRSGVLLQSGMVGSSMRADDADMRTPNLRGRPETRTDEGGRPKSPRLSLEMSPNSPAHRAENTADAEGYLPVRTLTPREQGDLMSGRPQLVEAPVGEVVQHFNGGSHSGRTDETP